MSDDAVVLERDGAIAKITLNRPAALNAIDGPMADQLARLTGLVESDDSIRCMLLSGAGGSFMAGGDIRYFQSVLDLDPQQREAKLRGMIAAVNASLTSIRNMGKPVIAAVHGSVVGFGLSLVCGCDVVLAAQSCRFMPGYCQLGVSPDGGITYALPRIVGARRAMALTLLGDALDARQALEFGIVHRIFDDATLAAEAGRIAASLARQATAALGGAKRLLNQSFENDWAGQLAAEAESFVKLAASQDFATGVAAFTADHKPNFIGR